MFKVSRRFLVLPALALILSLAACSGGQGGGAASTTQVTAASAQQKTASTAPATHLSEAELQKMEVNEGGEIPVLMYHRITPDIPPGDKYSRTPDQFRADLNRLYKEGYISASMSDLVDGKINIPPGKTPVVFTFDDSKKSQFHYLKDGSVDSNSAVGIMNAFYEKHPDFGRNAIFYANQGLFNQPGTEKKKLDQLIGWGYEIGNHTLTHANLSKLSPEGVQKEIWEMDALLKKLEPNYKVRHFCLPFGAEPRPQALATKGSYNGVVYSYDSDVLVGADPSPSPFAKRFDPLNIPRIRAAGTPQDELMIGYWLDRLAQGGRYISDGDPNTVTVPKGLESKMQVRQGQTLRTY